TSGLRRGPSGAPPPLPSGVVASTCSPRPSGPCVSPGSCHPPHPSPIPPLAPPLASSQASPSLLILEASPSGASFWSSPRSVALPSSSLLPSAKEVGACPLFPSRASSPSASKGGGREERE